MNIEEKALEKIKQILEIYPEIKLGYVFGSRVSGESGPLSDYDFAVYFDEPDVIKRHDILFGLSSEISKTLHTDLIDIVSLNDVGSQLLKFQIISEGKLILEKEPYRLIIEPRILNEYFDFRYLLKKYNLTQT